ncbi:MAG: GNAT family N-acetyltransferase [Myxococcaceae bacterium]
MKAYTTSDATLSDVAEIIDWLKQEATAGLGFYHNRELIEKGQKQGHVRVIKKTKGGPVLGFLLKAFDSISIIEVKRRWRGKGLAATLVKEALKNFEEERQLGIQIQCTPSTSIPFWEKMGFQMLTRERGYSQQAFYFFDKSPEEMPEVQKVPVHIKIFEFDLINPGTPQWEWQVQGFELNKETLLLEKRVGTLIHHGRSWIEVWVDGALIFKNKAKYSSPVGVEYNNGFMRIDKINRHPKSDIS